MGKKQRGTAAAGRTGPAEQPKRPRGRPFARNDPRINRAGRPRKVPPPEPILDASVPVVLAATRAALNWEHDEPPRHPAVRMLVQLREDDVAWFFKWWQRLEQQFRKSVEAPAPQA